MGSLLLIFLLLLITEPPVKQEVEIRIPTSEFPESALALLKPKLTGATDVRYFKETDGVSNSFEVKFWRDGVRWSVEFSQDGTFEDVEVERALSHLPQTTASAIRSTLSARFSRYSIRKLQIQYTSWPPDFGEPAAYELIVEGTTPRELGVFELKLDPNGTIRLERRVVEIPDL